MTKDEMRFIRREYINSLLPYWNSAYCIRWIVRLFESAYYEQELKVYG